MDDILRAILLGIVQGVTEFLPISSSGHLILVPALFRWDDQGLAFDVGLHLGTLVALLAYFWRDWWRMATSLLRDLWARRAAVRAYAPESKLALYIAAGTVPAAILGLAFADAIEAHTREPWIVATTLAVVGVVMLAAERVSGRDRTLGSVGLRDAIIIGVAQATALVPGVSRSGATISAGLFLHLERDSAARFAFLLGTPAFLGAGILTAGDLAGEGSIDAGEMAAGFVASAVVGFVAIHWLLRFLRTRSLAVFAYYRFAVAALTLIIAAFRVA